MKSYKIVNAWNTYTLQTLVNKSIREGWIPVGGVTWTPEDQREEPAWDEDVNGGLVPVGNSLITNRHWYQAMMFPESDEILAQPGETSPNTTNE